jgi:hypothetical protein
MKSGLMEGMEELIKRENQWDVLEIKDGILLELYYLVIIMKCQKKFKFIISKKIKVEFINF